MPNTLWSLFTVPEDDCPLVFRDEERPVMVATLRAAYGRYALEPAWEGLIRRLSAASPYFARLWDTGDVARPGGVCRCSGTRRRASCG
ncbi:hypothetical protein [Streptomyces bullii]|uniref:MmyB-like transcription regulator ligand binding domain-containing protein n=1 Tax=Streptomyces bullii TaxID=349910 RepID=A0ABW0UI62_9ACTN